MFPTPRSRASADDSSARAADVSRKLTPELESPVIRWTIRDLDHRFQEFQEYAEMSLGHSPDTRRNYKGTYSNFRTFLASFPAEELPHKLFAIEEWIRWNRTRGVSPVTLNTYFRQLRPFFQDLEKRDGIQNPYQGLKPPPMPSLIPKARSQRECQHILASAENYDWTTPYERWRAMGLLGVMLYAGLRRGEVLKLQFLDVNMDQGTIRVNRGKGKGGGKDRVVYIAPELREILSRYLVERRRRGFMGPGFFASMEDGQPISLSTFRRIIDTVRRASGIKFSVHSLRHSFVTMLLKSGVPIHVARDLAGHSSITTTAGYLRVWDEDKQKEVKKLSFR